MTPAKDEVDLSWEESKEIGAKTIGNDEANISHFTDDNSMGLSARKIKDKTCFED